MTLLRQGYGGQAGFGGQAGGQAVGRSAPPNKKQILHFVQNDRMGKGKAPADAKALAGRAPKSGACRPKNKKPGVVHRAFALWQTEKPAPKDRRSKVENRKSAKPELERPFDAEASLGKGRATCGVRSAQGRTSHVSSLERR